jgi:hypothetical protein
MAFITTNPSPFLINIPELQNVVTSATGSGTNATLTNSVETLLTYINTTSGAASFNSIGSVNTTNNITVRNNLDLENSVILMNGSVTLTPNNLAGASFLGLGINGTETMRIAGTSVGIGLTAPAATLDVNGPTIVRGSLYVTSTIVGSAAPSLGNIYADGDLYANGTYYPSDPTLKKDVRLYEARGLPTPVEFLWRSDGVRDIGVLADEVAALEPACVQRKPDGTLAVDYAKMTVLLLAEVRDLKRQVAELQGAMHQ